MQFKYAFFFFILFPFSLFAQKDDEKYFIKTVDPKLFAATKQLNQFIARFNNTEDIKGNSYGDSIERNNAQRIGYLNAIFNLENPSFKEETKQKFIQKVTDKKNPIFISTQSGNWFAQLETVFERNGEECEATLFLRKELSGQGSKWVIFDVYLKDYISLFQPKYDTINFLHPMSHELGFMPLRKELAKTDHLETYFDQNLQLNHLTLFFIELKSNKIKFLYSKATTYHFLNVDNWYFKLSFFNRKGNNTGWLIDQLIEIPERDKKILYENICKVKL
jgi:hypothetical protein